MQEPTSLLDEVREEQREGFEINDDGMADWAIRKIMAARADADRWDAFYDEQKVKRRNEAEGTEAFFSAALERYFDSVPKKETKTQASYPLPSGKLVRKVQQPKIIKDDEELADFLRDRGLAEYIKTTTVIIPVWGEFKKQTEVVGNMVVYKDTGEVVGGVTVELRAPVFRVEEA